LNFEGLPHPKEKEERERKEKERAATETEAGNGEGRQEEKGPQVEIQITDAEGETIRTLKETAYLGVNRVVWDLRGEIFKEPPRGDEPRFRKPQGPEVLPGTYGVTLKFKDSEAKATVEVVPDPRYQIAEESRRAKSDAIHRAGALQELVTEAVERLQRTRSDVDAALERADEGEKAEEEGGNPKQQLRDAAKALKKALAVMERRLWRSPQTKGIVAQTDALWHVQYVLRSLSSTWDAPTPAQLAYLGQGERLLEGILADFNQLYETQVAEFRRQVEALGIELLPASPPITLNQE
jgi:hypothetical protein